MRTNHLSMLIIGVWSIIGVVLAGNEEAKIVLYFGDSSKVTVDLNQTTKILSHVNFDSNRKTVFYMHGYIETLESSTVQKIINAFTKRNDYNLLILDWSTLASGLYPTAVRKSSELGPRIAEIFIDLFDQGLIDHSKLHLVGHSLGSHLAGQIGRTITEKSSGRIKLQRITGLDPAYPQYYPISFGGTKPISEKDAVLVDIIHTDAGRYGTPSSTGTVDFWPNEGKRFQPGCPPGLHIPLRDRDLCSHQRSVTLFAESVERSSSTFVATNRNNATTKMQMGIGCSLDAMKGDYDLKTKNDYPYSLSE